MKTHFSLVFLSVVLGLVGCGGGGSNTEPPTPGPAPIVVEPTPTPTPVPIPGPVAPKPRLDVFRASTSTPGIAPSPIVSLEWAASNVDSCEAMGGEGTSWAGTRAKSGTEAVSGVQTDTNYMFKLVCTGEGGTVNGSVSVMIPTPPPPPPPPPPILPQVSITCDGLGAGVSINPQGFRPSGECVLSADEAVTLNGDVILTVEGFLDKVLEIRAMQISCKSSSRDRVLATSAMVVGGKARLTFKNLALENCGTVGKREAHVSFEPRFAPLEPLVGVSESSRIGYFKVMAESDIRFVESVAFSKNTFPLQVGFARLANGKVFFTGNDEVFRRDIYSGEEKAVTYSGGNSYSFRGDMFASRDGNRVMFQRRYPYIIDTDGAGCTEADLVVVSPGCNKGLITVPLDLSSSNTSGWATITDGFSPDGTMFAYTRSTLTAPGGPYLANVYLGQINTGAFEKISNDQYGGSSIVIGSTGAYFYSRRPDCGIYWTEIDFSTGKPVGIIKLIYAHAEGDNFSYVLSSVSADGKQLLLYHEYENKVFLLNTDGTGFRQIGKGINPKFASDGRITFGHPSRGVILADSDGGNQVILDILSLRSAFVP